MCKNDQKHCAVRVDNNILEKFQYVCGYVGRSASSQIIWLMLKFISEYEKKHGEIELPDNTKK